MTTHVDKFDSLMKRDGGCGLTRVVYLQPLDGDDGDKRLAPASFAPAKSADEKKDKKKSVFNFCKEPDGTRNCVVNSVAAEAHRMESIFKEKPYSSLMPHNLVRWEEECVDLLDVPHRACDALVRYTALHDEIVSAITAFRRGDAEPLARISPSSLVFGFWDSRDSYVKWGRTIASDIFAYNVSAWNLAGSYKLCMDYDSKLEKAGLYENKKIRSKLGINQCVFNYADRGGVVVRGDIIRKSTISLTHLRNLPCQNEEKAKKLWRYCLGIALVALTYETDYAIRSGCELIWDRSKKTNGIIILRKMQSDEPFSLTHDEALEFALAAAEDFGVSTKVREVLFSPTALKKGIDEKKKSEDDEDEVGADQESENEEENTQKPESVAKKPRRRAEVR